MRFAINRRSNLGRLFCVHHWSIFLKSSSEEANPSNGPVRAEILTLPMNHLWRCFHLSACHAELVEQLQFLPKIRAAHFAGE